MKTRTTSTIIAEIDATELFLDKGGANCRFCTQNATYHHWDDAEYIIDSGSRDAVVATIREMEKCGCTAEFIQAYTSAVNAGAKKVVFYA